MHLLFTAGNTQAPIDRVRCITNIFTGRTGAAIAMRAVQLGHTVTLLTSHPETIDESAEPRPVVIPYRTFDDLRDLMRKHLAGNRFEALIHCAAVSDFLVEAVHHTPDGPPIDLSGKLKSDAPELWLRLVRAPKLIDAVRSEWRFRGVLVKFKLEVGIGDERLIEVAERSRQQSVADLMVANTLDGAAEWSLLGPIDGGYKRVARHFLADRLLDAIADLLKGR
jgi:phosphopantothenoylcysteine synthetase/decarboxylase